MGLGPTHSISHGVQAKKGYTSNEVEFTASNLLIVGFHACMKVLVSEIDYTWPITLSAFINFYR